MRATETNAAAPPQFDFLLKGGHLIDPKNAISERMDVAVAGGRIATVAKDIPTSQAQKTVDVSGLYVTPGLIDMHVHAYPSHDHLGLVADAHSFSSGVTTMVDAGSMGGADFADFKCRVIDQSKTRVLAFLNIVDIGMGGDFEQDVGRMEPELAARTAHEYPEWIVGIKCAHYWTWQPWDERHRPWDNVDRALQAGELCHKPIMVDFWPRPPERSYADLILHKLRPGDIHTHVFAQQFPILGDDGHVNQILLQARERGVIFDLGHGAGSFWFRNAVPAMEQGFLPDWIGTDLHTGNVNGPVVNLQNVISKLLNMGVTLEDLIMRATVAPARAIGRPELGNLDLGTEADIAVWQLRQGRFGFTDCGKARMTGTQRLECVHTMRGGEVVFDPAGLTMPEWQKAPADYWVCRRPKGASETWVPPV